MLLRGTALAAPDKFGETLADEQARGGEARFLSVPNGRGGGGVGWVNKLWETLADEQARGGEA
eukprot:196167-Chlamydomonas_euryale.AAC.1